MMAPAYPAAAIGALTGHQRQIDSDGAFVGVSREALDEVIAWAQTRRAEELSPLNMSPLNMRPGASFVRRYGDYADKKSDGAEPALDEPGSRWMERYRRELIDEYRDFADDAEPAWCATAGPPTPVEWALIGALVAVAVVAAWMGYSA